MASNDSAERAVRAEAVSFMTSAPVVKLNLSVPEAAQALGVSPSLVKKYIRDGRIAIHKVGRRRLLRPRDVEAFNAASFEAEQCQVKANAEREAAS